MRFLPEGGALLVSDAARRCGDVRTLLNACRTAGFAAEERDGFAPPDADGQHPERVMRRMRATVRITDWDEEKASAAAFSVRLTAKEGCAADGRRTQARAGNPAAAQSG